MEVHARTKEMVARAAHRGIASSWAAPGTWGRVCIGAIYLHSFLIHEEEFHFEIIVGNRTGFPGIVFHLP